MAPASRKPRAGESRSQRPCGRGGLSQKANINNKNHATTKYKKKTKLFTSTMSTVSIIKILFVSVLLAINSISSTIQAARGAARVRSPESPTSQGGIGYGRCHEHVCYFIFK